MTLERMPDISHWQGPINFPLMTSRGIKRALLKATEGTAGIDTNFFAYAKGAHGAGLALSSYHFYKPLQDPVLQAMNFVSTARRSGVEMEAYVLDVEDPPTGALPHASRLLSCLLEIEKQSGMRPAIYTRSSFWRLYYPGAYAWALFYPLHVAHYKSFSGPDVTPPWDPENISAWQYTDRENGPLYGTNSKQIDMSLLYDWPPKSVPETIRPLVIALDQLPPPVLVPRPTFRDLLTETRFLFSFNPRKG